MPARAALIAAALLASPAASAQDGPAIDEAAADLAYGMCLPYLAGQMPLAPGGMLDRYGLKGPVRKLPNPRFGELEVLVAARPDGQISFGGVPNKVCQVTVTGTATGPVLAKLRTNMSFLPVPLKPDPANSGDRGIARMEAYKGPLEGLMLNVILSEAQSPTPTVVAHVLLTDK